MMKKIFIDPGEFYIKVLVLDYANSEGGWQFYGRTFFPAIAMPARATGVAMRTGVQIQQIYYENNNQFYQVGNDCTYDNVVSSKIKLSLLGNDQMLFLCKSLFDFSDDLEDVELYIVVDTSDKLQLFKEIIKDIVSIDGHQIRAYRNLDQRIINKRINVKFNFVSACDGICSLVRKKFETFGNALVVDIAHSSTKIYTINWQEGVRSFALLETGMHCYYQKIIKLLQERGIIRVDYFGLIKQIELGFDSIEVPSPDRQSTYKFDPSLVIDNIRWDLNKIFHKEIIDSINCYFVKLTATIDSLLIMGGGALLSGEIIRASLTDKGYKMLNIYIEKSPMYNILEGTCYYFGLRI